MLKMYCDLCGKPLDPDKSRNFKIKELNASWHEFWWQQIDAHVECVEKLLNSVKKEQEVKEQISDAIHETAKQFRQTIVRCRDCKKRNQHHECEYGYHSDNWFCADGEKS